MKKQKRGPKITCECGTCAKCYFRKQQRKRRKSLKLSEPLVQGGRLPAAAGKDVAVGLPVNGRAKR